MVENKLIKISVRNLVEFIMKSGDLDNTRVVGRDTEAMQAGSRIHRKIQKRQGPEYSAEVPLSIQIPIQQEDLNFDICVEGRADGVIHNEPETTLPTLSEPAESEPPIIIDEIKGMYMDLSYLEEPFGVHKAQAMCYAYIYGKNHDIQDLGIRLTYCNIETEDMKYFNETFTFLYLEQWFYSLIREYAKWAGWQYSWELSRNETIKTLQFPFEYRPGQKDLATGVYRTIVRKKKLFIEAPTGVGKTISTVFPAVKAMGEGEISKIFYLTAKTITRTVAEETYKHLVSIGLKMKVITITAKDKICILDKPDCNPISCERAKGHYDRVNDAVFDLLVNEMDLSRDMIAVYAEKHMVCPFEMCLDATLWADSIICDYNYLFDPNVYLRRFFQNEKKMEYAFLIDEAHNLVERAREMYSAVLYKDHFLQIKRLLQLKSKKMVTCLELCNKDMLALKRECDEFETVEHIQDFVLHLMRLIAEYEIFLQEHPSFDGRDLVLDLYFDLRNFMGIYELMDEKYVIYTDYHDTEGFRIKLQCMDPSTNILRQIEKGKSAIFFSATLLPIQYYKEQLGGNEEDYAIYAPSPFEVDRRLLMIARDVSTKYTKRNKQEYSKILDYISAFVDGKVGNYLVFFPSYSLMNQVLELTEEYNLFQNVEIEVQKSNMSESEKEEYLNRFIPEPDCTRIGFCVMGGIFSEGIDLKHDRLIGVVIVGTGLPMVCNERELFRGYYEEKNGAGFDYAYLYNGMNKVLQSAGRVIRTQQDKGAILLLDERFSSRQYVDLFPREWFPNVIVNRNTIKGVLEDFWYPNKAEII